MATHDTVTQTLMGKYKGIPPNVIKMQKKAGLPYSKKPVNNTGALLKGLVLPGSKRSKKVLVKNNNSGETIGYNGVFKKPAHSPLADNLFAENDNFVEVPSKTEIGNDAYKIPSHSMNSDVGLDKDWSVIFAYDVVIPVGNPMAPVLALSSSSDTAGPVSRQPSAASGPIGRTMTNLYEEPEASGYLSIQEIVKLKAAELIDQLNTKNKTMDDLFMDRV